MTISPKNHKLARLNPEALAPSENPALVYVSSLTSEKSRRTMRTALETIASILTEGQCGYSDLPWHLLRYHHTAALRARVAEKYAPATANKIISALKGVLKECRRLKLMTADDAADASDLKRISNSRLPAGRMLAAGELGALIRACCEDATAAGFRDAAMLGLLMAGLRRAEVVAVNFEDFDPATGEIKVIGGKGRKDRITYAPPGAAEAIADWLEVRGDRPGPLLHPVNKGGAVQLGKGMTDQAVLNNLMKRAKQAGIKEVSPHDFRRTFISNLLDAGNDIVTVQKLVGHSDPSTTARYDRRGEDAKRRAVEALHVPYRRHRRAP